jgi:hypothetical protein
MSIGYLTVNWINGLNRILLPPFYKDCKTFLLISHIFKHLNVLVAIPYYEKKYPVWIGLMTKQVTLG